MKYKDIKSLHVIYIMADMICHKVYEFLMSILNISTMTPPILWNFLVGTTSYKGIFKGICYFTQNMGVMSILGYFTPQENTLGTR
jgi:hypothetical protein